MKNKDCKPNLLAEAKALLIKYQEAYECKKAAEEQMKYLEKKAADELCVYHVGQEFLDRYGNKAVLTKIRASSLSMHGGVWGEPHVSFSYNFRKVRKDGQLSLNHFFVDIDDATPTGKEWDIEEDK